MAHRAGSKITRSHTTIIDAAARVVDEARVRPEVTKVALGIIRQIGKGPPRLKFTPIQNGWKIMVRGNTTMHELFVYTAKPQLTKRELTQAFKR